MKKNKSMLVWTVILIIISFILTTCISVSSLNTVIEGHDEEMSKVLASKVYDSINNVLSEPITAAKTMSNDYYLIEPLKEDGFPKRKDKDILVSYLDTIKNNMEYSSVFVVSDKSRTYYTQDGFNKIVSPETDKHDIWYSRFVESGEKYNFDVDTDEAHNNIWTIFVNARIEDENNNFLGVCGVSVRMTELQDILCEYEKKYNIKINLVNNEGIVQIDTDMVNLEKAIVDIDVLKDKDRIEYIYHEEKNGEYTVSKYVESLGWHLVIHHSGENNVHIYSDIVYKNVLIFFVILAACIIMVSSNLIFEKKKMEEHAFEKERYAKEQETLKVQAEAASRAKDDFLANMSHEIRTPINAVLGMDEMILRESSDEMISDYAYNIKMAGNTLLNLVNDILDFSKIESGKMNIVPVNYNLGDMLDELIDIIRPKTEKKNLAFKIQVEPGIPAHLYGDEIRIRQVITNILANAVKYTEKGCVCFEVSGRRLPDGNVVLYVSVKDTGIGIREEDKEKLFESFIRLDENRNRNIEGTGLGLSITMRLLELMGSRLEVESTYLKGSDFYFYLEQKVLDEEVIGDFHINYEQKKRETCVYKEQFISPDARILVVDDNEVNLKVFLGLLKNSQMQIDTAICGKDCLALMQQNKYHIIFMEHRMPEMDGIETLKRSKTMKNNLCKDSVIIALTANAITGVREMFIEEGFDDYLSKPVIAERLEEMIQRYLPEEIVIKTAREQLDKETEKPGSIIENNILDWEEGKNFCKGDEEFYKEMLQAFLDSHYDIELQDFYKASDFENYFIKIHSIKTNLKNIGAVEASKLALELELSFKENNDIQYVIQNHNRFILVYKEVEKAAREYLSFH